MSKITNSEVGHAWYYGDNISTKHQPNNLYYEGDTIYSYGSHFDLATKHTVNGETIVLFNSGYYSSTTSQHQSKVRNSIPRNTKIFAYGGLDTVCNRGDREGRKKSHKANYGLMEKEMERLLNKASRARSNKAHYLNDAQATMNDMNLYTKLFKLGKRQVTMNFENLDSLMADMKAAKIKEEKQKAAAKRKKIAQQKEELAEKIKQWKSGTRISLYTADFVLLRVNGDYIQSSQGARFKVSECKALWAMIKKTISGGVTLRPMVELSGFTLMLISAKGDIKIGCHSVKFEEIRDIANLLNFEPVKVSS